MDRKLLEFIKYRSRYEFNGFRSKTANK